jgi:anti-sigma factor RsiW
MDAEMHSGRDQHDEDMTSQPCASWEPLLTLLAAGELDPAAHDRLAAHLAGCAACSADFRPGRSWPGTCAISGC